ncbi:uncharacterized protein ZBAI_00115 [Zygosaccharomyces bailii ISA1307]|nr:uncharacterized protein ZBAI_00115 [Zygosaccharomyces bailii ISA1307]
MFRARGLALIRTFHSCQREQGSSLKEKLRNVQQHDILMNKSSKELAKLDAKKRIQFKKLQKSAYPRQQALHLLKQKHGDLDEEIKAAVLGPTSQDDLKHLIHTKDKRMIYTILGVSGDQLRDSKLIAGDVKKFLRRGQVEKAVFLSRLAKKKGSAAMNAVMEYYFNEKQAPQSGIDMYNWRKKWGIPSNEFTNTILFNGLAQQKRHVSKASGDLVLKTIDRLVKDNELSQIEYNAAISALSNCTDVTAAFELYERKIKGISKDAITHLWILRACKRIASDVLFQELVLTVLRKIPASCIDAQLLFEFCKTLNSRADCGRLQSMTILALNEYFEIELDQKSFPKPIKDFHFVPLSHWSIRERYPLSMSVIGLLLDNCLQTGQYELGIHFFRQVSKHKRDMLDIDMFHKYMELLIRGHSSTCGDQCLEVFNEIENDSNLPTVKHSLVLLYRAFEKQARKKVNNSERDKIDKFLKKCLCFIKEVEGVYSKEFNDRVYPAKSWKSIFSILKAANAHEAVGNRCLVAILDDYLKSSIRGEFEQFKSDSPSAQRFVELELVRLLNQIALRMALPQIENVDHSLPSTERTIFLQRRRLLQLRNCVLKHVEALESENRNKDVLEKWELALREKARHIILDHATEEFNKYVLER